MSLSKYVMITELSTSTSDNCLAYTDGNRYSNYVYKTDKLRRYFFRCI